ncbi:hypothetical protein LUZ60_015982 [Juncus effusus]|nr:hypothetical protein LUZ60_015982 [Juncus effusus]
MPPSDPPPEEEEDQFSPINNLPPDTLHNIFLRLTLRDALACRAVSRSFHVSLSSPSFLTHLPSLRLLLLRHPRPSAASPALHAFDPALRRWILLPLPFLPPHLSSFSPVSASPSLLYLWLDPSPPNPKSLAVCNPLSRTYRLLPPLGSAWSRHGTVLAGPRGTLLVLTELAVLSYSPHENQNLNRWLKHPLSLPSKPRSPVLINETLFTLCDVGTPWRSQWKLFACPLAGLGFGSKHGGWAPVDRQTWGDVFEVMKRPRLLAGSGGKRLLMIGGLRSSFAVEAPCSTVLILRLDLNTMEWDEAGRMPADKYRCFTGIGGGESGGAGPGMSVGVGNNKVKVFGGEGRVWFSGKRVRGKIAMWEEEEGLEGSGGTGGDWSWVDGVPGYNEGVYRGFVLDAGFTASP